VVFCSVKPIELPGRSLLRRYLEAINQPANTNAASVPADAFLCEVQATLSARGFKIWPCYLVAGLPVDMLIEKSGRSLGIDLVGYPGHLSDAFDLEKYRLFHRAGLRLFPLSFSAWQKKRQACLDAIDVWLSNIPCA